MKIKINCASCFFIKWIMVGKCLLQLCDTQKIISDQEFEKVHFTIDYIHLGDQMTDAHVIKAA